MPGKIKRVFLNVSMANRFDGLQKIAQDAGVKVKTMTGEDYVIFVNRDRDRVAMLVGAQAPGLMQTMAYVKLEKGRKVEMRVISEIPRAFDGKTLNYDQALSLALTKAMKKDHKFIEMV